MKTILVVEDSTFQQRILKKHLTEAGYKVEIAANGREALTLLGTVQPFLIIMDLIMPEMNGVQLLEHLRDLKGIPPIIVHTADIQHTTYEECMALGAYEVVNKPAERDELLALVTQIEESIV